MWDADRTRSEFVGAARVSVRGAARSHGASHFDWSAGGDAGGHRAAAAAADDDKAMRATGSDASNPYASQGRRYTASGACRDKPRWVPLQQRGLYGGGGELLVLIELVHLDNSPVIVSWVVHRLPPLLVYCCPRLPRACPNLQVRLDMPDIPDGRTDYTAWGGANHALPKLETLPGWELPVLTPRTRPLTMRVCVLGLRGLRLPRLLDLHSTATTPRRPFVSIEFGQLEAGRWVPSPLIHL